MFWEFMRGWEDSQLSESASLESQSARQAHLDHQRDAIERGPGGDVDADGHLTRAGYVYVPGLKRTMSMWLRMRERYERGELGGELDGIQNTAQPTRHTRRTVRSRSARPVRAPVRSLTRSERVPAPTRQAPVAREPERSAWAGVLDQDLKHLVLTWIDTVLWDFVLLGALATLACVAFNGAVPAWLVGLVVAVAVAAVVITIVIVRTRAPHGSTQVAPHLEEEDG